MTSDDDLDLLTELLHIRQTVDRIADALGITQREHDDYRSAVTGRYVSAQQAQDNPDTTVHEGG